MCESCRIYQLLRTGVRQPCLKPLLLCITRLFIKKPNDYFPRKIKAECSVSSSFLKLTENKTKPFQSETETVWKKTDRSKLYWLLLLFPPRDVNSERCRKDQINLDSRRSRESQSQETSQQVTTWTTVVMARILLIWRVFKWSSIRSVCSKGKVPGRGENQPAVAAPTHWRPQKLAPSLILLEAINFAFDKEKKGSYSHRIKYEFVPAATASSFRSSDPGCVSIVRQIIIVRLNFNNIWHLSTFGPSRRFAAEKPNELISSNDLHAQRSGDVYTSGGPVRSEPAALSRLVLSRNGESSAARAVTGITPDAHQDCLSSSSAWLRVQHQKTYLILSTRWLTFQHKSSRIADGPRLPQVVHVCVWV